MLKRAKEPNGLYALHAVDNQIEDPKSKNGPKKDPRCGGHGGCVGRHLFAGAAALRREHLQRHRQRGPRTQHHRHRDGHAPRSARRPGHTRDSGHPRRHGPGIGKMAADVLARSNVTTFIYHPAQPLTTIKRHLIVVPEKAETGGGIPGQAAPHPLSGREFGRQDRGLRPGDDDGVPASGKAANARRTSISCRSNCGTTCRRSNTTCADDDCLWFVMSRRERVPPTTPP